MCQFLAFWLCVFLRGSHLLPPASTPRAGAGRGMCVPGTLGPARAATRPPPRGQGCNRHRITTRIPCRNPAIGSSRGSLGRFSRLLRRLRTSRAPEGSPQEEGKPATPHFGQRSSSSSSLSERMQARAGFSVAKLSMPGSEYSGAQSPYLTIPPGLSPASLLESPVFLSNAMVCIVF